MSALKKYVVTLAGLCAIYAAGSVQAFSWAPISPDELKMTAEPKAPGASAIILEMRVDRDDAESKVSVYQRIKILTDEGRKHGDVEVRYEKGDESVRYIEARTIHPDGAIIEFDGKIFDKLIIKGKGERYQAKTFSLPQVQTGSIVEYRFVKYFPPYWVYNSRWVLREELFIKHAQYSLVPNGYYGLRWSWPRGLPPDTAAPAEKNSKICLETHDVPAFEKEDFAPPENELKYRIDFVYNVYQIKEKDSPVKFWQEAGKIFYKHANEFMDERRAMEKVVAQLILPTDSAEEKLRKLYAHVQHLRNLSYEKDRTEQEQKRDKIKEIENVADVEKYGYGNAFDLTYLYIALARAAGFQSDMVWVSTRDQYFFEPNAMNPTQLTSNLATVTVDGKELFIEPGVPYVPFGILPWGETGVSGLRLGKEGGTWVKIPLTKASQAITSRKAILKLEDGALVGTVEVAYSGLEAIHHRIEQRYDDATARKESMEIELKRVIPTGAEVTLVNSPDWDGVGTPLVVEYKIKVPGWASSAGKHLLMPIGLFGADERHTFEQEKRIHPIYFRYANQVDDEINVELPSGWQATSLPKSHDENISITTFSASVESKGNFIQIKRNLSSNGVYAAEKYYLALHEFFQTVRANDEEQIVLTRVATTPVPVKSVASNH